jgi:hypothetical protein
VGDQEPSPSYAATNQSGVYFRDGRAKPALRAFSFPFVARQVGRRMEVWGRAPAAGALAIERRTASGWTTVRRLAVHARDTFFTHISQYGDMSLRARVGSAVSLTWSTRSFAR